MVVLPPLAISHLLSAVLNAYPIRVKIASYLLGYEIARFIAAFRLKWTEWDKNACRDVVRNLFERPDQIDTLTTVDTKVVIMGRHRRAIKSRVINPLNRGRRHRYPDTFTLYTAAAKVIECKNRANVDGPSHHSTTAKYACDVPYATEAPITLWRSVDNTIKLHCLLQGPEVHHGLKLNVDLALNTDMFDYRQEDICLDVMVISRTGSFVDTVFANTRPHFAPIHAMQENVGLRIDLKYRHIDTVSREIARLSRHDRLGGTVVLIVPLSKR